MENLCQRNSGSFGGSRALVNKMNVDLIYAASHGDLLEVKRLLAAGAEVNAKDEGGKKPH